MRPPTCSFLIILNQQKPEHEITKNNSPPTDRLGPE